MNFRPMAAACLIAAAPLAAMAWHSVKVPNVKGLQVVLNDDFEALPVLRLGSSDVLHIGFDEMSHEYHRFTCTLEPCNPDWTPAGGLFDSDWLAGINGLPIDNYENSINTVTLYNHYAFDFPNRDCRPRASGNYRLHIVDDDSGDEAITIEFRVVEPVMNVGLSATTNTDIALNTRYQQVNMTVNFNNVRVTRPDEQIQTIVMQNGREDNMKTNVRPTYITPTQLKWEHQRELIFDAGNEYHKFEMLDPSHTTMGLASTAWDENTRTWHATPFPCEQRRNYSYDEDANGASLQRNSDNYDFNRTSEYINVHYQLLNAPRYDNADVIVSGRWANEDCTSYAMEYDEENRSYSLTVLQKMGYYNYMLLLADADGTTHPLPEEGSFFQTENCYQAFVYYRGTGARAWRLLGFQEIKYRP